MAVSSSEVGRRAGRAGRITRHRLVDRLFHWSMAISIIILLVTAFFPILGYRIPGWLTIHWVAGVVLSVLVAFHIVRAVFWQGIGTMMVGPRDLVAAWRSLRAGLGARIPVPKQGKYSMAQKLYHLGVIAVIGLLIITGLLMLAKIDTPLWRRQAVDFLLTPGQWGMVYVIHGIAAMATITLIILHVYFAIRPEKLFFTRSMIVGWITRDEYRRTFDSDRWPVAGETPAATEAATEAEQRGRGPARMPAE